MGRISTYIPVVPPHGEHRDTPPTVTGIAIGQGLGPFGGGPLVWTPKSLSGLVTWLRADLGATVTTGIARWLDYSGNLNHVEQATLANRPTLSGGALDFDLSSLQHLEDTVNTAVSSGYTVGIAVQMSSLSASDQNVFVNGNGSTGLTLGVTSTPVRRQLHYGASSPWVINWGTATTNAETWVFRHTGGTNLADFNLDGSNQTQQSLTDNVTPSGSMTIADGGGGARQADCKIWGIVIYSDRKSDTITGNISTYLTALRNGTALPSWRPDDETNLELWLEMPHETAGSALSAWADQSGMGRDVAQTASTAQPVLIPGRAGGVAGLPFVDFDGVSEFLAGAWVQAQPVHRFLMAVPSVSRAANKTICDGPGGNRGRIYTGLGHERLVSHSGVGISTPAPSPLTLSDWYRVDMGCSGASSHIRANAAEGTGNGGTTAPSGLTLGAYSTGTSGWADCRIAEVIEYNRILTSAEQTKVHAYLTARYGV